MTLRPLAIVLLSAITLTSCTQVLGLERAELESTSSNVGPPRPTSLTLCHRSPREDCAACLQAECQILPQECASDPDCRRQLEKYTTCKGANCDGTAEECGSEIADLDVRDCVFACADECPTNIISRCETYCACLDGYCPEAAETLENCLVACAEWSDEVRECQLQHCEYVRGMDDRKNPHCGHAIGAPPVCESFDQRPVAERDVCLTGFESNWPCTQDEECCSKDCLSSDTCL
jgi:hypothetical protein